MYKEKPKSLIWESPYDDDTEEEKMDREVEIWKKHYSSKHRILLVGEGDFSFSLCIARAFGFARNMVATSLDTQEDIARKYRKGIGNVRKLEERGCFVLHEVDAEQMSQHFFLRTQRFDRIVYNFPHVGFLFSEGNHCQIQLNKILVKSFLKNAKVLLRKEGEIHVAHKEGEPYSKWDLVGIAEEIGLVLHDVVPFYKDEYPGYRNKRGHGSCPDAQFNLGDCSTYKFRLNHSPLLNFDEQDEADRPAEEAFGGEDESSIGKRNSLQQMSQGSVSKHSEYKPKVGSTYRQGWLPSHGSKDGFSNVVRSQQGINSPDGIGIRSKQSKCMGTSDSAQKQDFPQLSVRSGSEDLDAGRIQPGVGTADGITLHDDFHQKLKISGQQGETQLPSISAKKDEPSPCKDPKSSAGHTASEHSEHSAMIDSFDLCPTKPGISVTLKPLLVKNRERRNEVKCSMEGQNGKVLRAGMVLLKSCISVSDQVKIVKTCRDLGLGPGGFYRPGYRDGAKLRLKMMCLGRNWDPETSEYDDRRPLDDAKPPTIPAEFYQLVEKAIKDSHSLIQKKSKSSNVKEILPLMSPNICIVNFYSANGRLGLHQDRDESPESLARGLPVVSFSIGDKADFLYGDQRDVDKAEKVELESGDVLIFGGKSRHIFHGVTAIYPDTAPKFLLEETNLRPGRLNLTFREY